MNIFGNYTPNKKVKCNYCQPPWMNNKIKKCLRKRSKLTKFYYKHDQKKEDQEKLQANAAYCTEEMFKATNDYILRMTGKFNDPKAALNTCSSILTQLLYKMIPSIPSSLVNSQFISDLRVKVNLLNDFFPSICMPINNKYIATECI